MSPARKLTGRCGALTLFLHTVALLYFHVHGHLNLKSTDKLGQDCHCFLSAESNHGTP